MAALLGQARIIIDQATLGPGVANVSRDDGVIGQVVTCRNETQTNVGKYQWILLRPRSSTATLSNTNTASTQFTPDVDGTYTVLLLVNEGRGQLQRKRLLFGVRSTGGYRYPGQGESNEANWTSTFTGQANETGWWEDMDAILRANQSLIDGTVLTQAAEAGLPNSRQLAVDASLTMTDNGAGSTLQLKVAAGFSGVAALLDVAGQPENLVARRTFGASTRSVTKKGQVNFGASGVTSGDYTGVLSGQANTATLLYDVVVGGAANTANGGYAFVGGGEANSNLGTYAVIVGGAENDVSGDYAVVVGGRFCGVSADKGFVGAGDSNIVSGARGFVGAGQSNTPGGVDAVICGGDSNASTQAASFIGGGTSNNAAGEHAAIVGGENNSVVGDHGVVAGGLGNSCDHLLGFIGGGTGNVIQGNKGAIAGGDGNEAGVNCFVGGGDSNIAGGTSTVIVGGSGNSSSGSYGAILAGLNNSLSGDYGVIGGRDNVVSGTDGMALGRGCSSTHAGAVIIKDGDSTTVASSAANELTMSGKGGIRQFFNVRHRRSGFSSVANFLDLIQGQATTTGNTTVNLDIFAIPTGQDVRVIGCIKGKRNTNNDFISRKYDGEFLNVGGVITTVTATLNSVVVTNAVAWTATVAANSTNVRIAYTGAAATTIYWTWSFEFFAGGAV